VNEAIEERATGSGLTAYEFICECSSASCAERIELTRLQYEHVRAEGTRFFVVPGHEKRGVEVVVETQPTYLVVEKDGLAGLTADEADPRDTTPRGAGELAERQASTSRCEQDGAGLQRTRLEPCAGKSKPRRRPCAL
jgi:hypothetical protein